MVFICTFATNFLSSQSNYLHNFNKIVCMAEDTEYPDVRSSKQVPHLTAIPIQPHTESHWPSHTTPPVKNMNTTEPGPDPTPFKPRAVFPAVLQKYKCNTTEVVSCSAKALGTFQSQANISLTVTQWTWMLITQIAMSENITRKHS